MGKRWELKKTTTVELTKALVDHYNALPRIAGERRIEDERVDFIGGFIEAGEARPFNIAIAYCAADGKYYLVNSSHTLDYLTEEGYVVPPGLMAHIEEYHCHTMDNVVNLWNSFDAPQAVRATVANLRPLMANNPMLCDISLRCLQTAQAAIAMYKTSQTNTRWIPAAERNQMLLDEIGFVRWFAKLVTGEDGNILRRVGVAYAMLRTYIINKKEATRFWTAVRDGTSQPDDAARALQKLLIRNGKEQSNRVMALAATALRAWVLWLDGKKVRSLPFTGKMPVLS